MTYFFLESTSLYTFCMSLPYTLKSHCTLVCMSSDIIIIHTQTLLDMHVPLKSGTCNCSDFWVWIYVMHQAIVSFIGRCWWIYICWQNVILAMALLEHVAGKAPKGTCSWARLNSVLLTAGNIEENNAEMSVIVVATFHAASMIPILGWWSWLYQCFLIFPTLSLVILAVHFSFNPFQCPVGLQCGLWQLCTHLWVQHLHCSSPADTPHSCCVR